MSSGRFRYEKVDLDSGPGLLSLVRVSGPPVEVANGQVPVYFGDNPLGQFTHNWNIRFRFFQGNAQGGVDRHLEIGERRQMFSTGQAHAICPIVPAKWLGRHGIAFENCQIDLPGTYNDRIKYYVRSADLGYIEFDAGVSGYCRENDQYCAASKLVRPDGTEYLFDYDVAMGTPRLRRVRNNRGFALVFLYSQGGELAASPTKICLINLTEYSIGSSFNCPSSAISVEYTYANRGHLSSATDAGGNVHRYESTYNEAAHFADRAAYLWEERYFRPGEAQPYLVNSIKRPLIYEAVQQQIFYNGPDPALSISYSWDDSSGVVFTNNDRQYIAGGVYQVAGAPPVTVEVARHIHWGTQSEFPADGPTRVVDELGRTLIADRCEGDEADDPYLPGCVQGGRLQSVTYPDDSRVEYEYENLSSLQPSLTRRIPKPGSSLPPIEERTAFDCSIYYLCRAPLYQIDGRGNRTDFTYSGTTGALLSVTSPADASGVRPQVRSKYTKKYAWTKSGGAFVKAQTGIWLLEREEYCRTSSSTNLSLGANSVAADCAAGSTDEVVTTYEYQSGDASKGSNLLLVGTAVTSQGVTLRTCYEYDSYGRKIAETSPLGASGACQ